jgi:hypothetical protein
MELTRAGLGGTVRRAAIAQHSSNLFIAKSENADAEYDYCRISSSQDTFAKASFKAVQFASSGRIVLRSSL